MMLNKYEIWFDGELIGQTGGFSKAMDIATEVLEIIKKYPKEPDEYQLLQIRCYNWLLRILGAKDKNGFNKHQLIVWSELEQRFMLVAADI